MADKSVTLFLIDLGSSVGDCNNGRMESDLDYGMQYIWDKIAKIMIADKISWQVGVIGFRTDETRNHLSDEEGYDNISVLKDIGPMKMNELSQLRSLIQTSETEEGDAISAIALATDMITTATTLKSTGKLGKYNRKIYLLTNGQGNIDDDGLDEIAKKITETEIELIVLGVDFDDEDFGFQEEDKSSAKRRAEGLLKRLTENCLGKDEEPNGVFGTVAQALEDISIPEPKKTRPFKTFNGKLELGDPVEYPETALYIDVQRFFKTKPAVVPPASSFVSRPVAANGAGSPDTLQDAEMTDAPSGDMLRVRNNIEYEINDAEGAGGKRQLERDELAKGYRYGSTIVAMEAANVSTTKFETLQSFSIIGFIPWDKYERYLSMGNSCITVAQPTNEKAKLAMSSLVHALYAVESYAVARLVSKDNKSPQIVLLAPLAEADVEGLVDVPLPFAEDIRVYRFPPLDKIISLSGKTITTHRLLPSEDLDEAISDYVDSMDLSKFGTDDDGNPAEYMTIDETFNPVIHRVNQAICKRAVLPDSDVDEPAEILMKWSHPPEALVEKATPDLEKLIKVAKLQKVPPKAKGKRSKETTKPLSGLNIEALITKPQMISRENAIPEFKQMLRKPENDNVVLDACRQMGDIILDLVKNSLGSQRYDEAAANMRVFRRKMADEFEMPDAYNNFLRNLKKKVLSDEYGRKDFWQSIRYSNLGLIDQSVVPISDVTEEEATEFMKLQESGSKPQLPTRSC